MAHRIEFGHNLMYNPSRPHGQIAAYYQASPTPPAMGLAPSGIIWYLGYLMPILGTGHLRKHGTNSGFHKLLLRKALAAMQRLLSIALFISISFLSFGQANDSSKADQLSNIVTHFTERWESFQKMRELRGAAPNVTKRPSRDSLYRDEDFTLSISRNPVIFDTSHLILKNPYYSDDFDDYDDNYINYPTSYSGIYDGKLISLFRNGKFVVYDLSEYQRDIKFENELNTKNFSYHWVSNGKLYARSKNQLFNRLYVWSGDKWVKARINLPVKDQPILFEDEKFIVFGDCHGEWGGTVYFSDKASGETYFTESTCANSVIKKDGKYLVLAHLGHMMGLSEVKSISNPRQLSKAKNSEIKKTKKEEQALGYSDYSEAYQKQLVFFGIQLFSTFKYGDRQLYIAHLNELTFLTEIDGSEIKIVHPLFNNEIYTHGPITKTYGDYTLINLDFYGTARDKEVAAIIIHRDKITKVDWNENQSQ